jgi:hypothetical protein
MTTATLKNKVTARIAKFIPSEAEGMVNEFFNEALGNGYKTPKQLAEAIITYAAM